MSAKTTYLDNKLLDHTLKNTAYVPAVAVYVALFTTAPDATGAGTEVAGGLYARQAATFDAAVAGSTANSLLIQFPVATAPWGTVGWMAIYDDPAAGNMLYFGPVGTPKAVGIGDQVAFAIGALTIGEQ